MESCFTSGLKGMQVFSFLRDVLCEALGTACFLFTSLASVVLWPQRPATSDTEAGLAPPQPTAGIAQADPLECHADPLQVALAFGIALAIVLLCFGDAASGGVHLNPAVTLALALGLRVSPWRAVLYVGAQLLGALCASASLLKLGPQPLCGEGALNQIATGVSPYQALIMEMAVTFLLVLCVFVTTQSESPYQTLGPVLVGLSVTLGHLVTIQFTSCGMNPARSFGPAVLSLNFHNHWVFWAGPCTGALLAGALHDLVLYPRWCSPAGWLAELKQVLIKGPHRRSRGLDNIEGE